MILSHVINECVPFALPHVVSDTFLRSVQLFVRVAEVTLNAFFAPG
jgi:hypothetical protein